MAAGTRERILGVSAEIFRRQGYEGTGLKQIVTAAKVPFGSLYHFFPGGKEQLGAEFGACRRLELQLPPVTAELCGAPSL